MLLSQAPPRPERNNFSDSDRNSYDREKAGTFEQKNGAGQKEGTQVDTGDTRRPGGQGDNDNGDDSDSLTYPEGGREAYLVLVGCWCALFGSLGLCNSTGTLEAYISSHQLRDESTGQIGWIFGVYLFLLFAVGVQIGPVFDARGPREMVIVGVVLLVLAELLLCVCRSYGSLMGVLGVLAGVATSLIYTPAIATPGHYFAVRRGRATGLVATGGSAGGIVLPLMLTALFRRVGWAWATRAMALVTGVPMVVGCLLMKSRLPRRSLVLTERTKVKTAEEQAKGDANTAGDGNEQACGSGGGRVRAPVSLRDVLPDLRILRRPIFAITTAGIFFVEWGLFIALTYICSYATAHGLSDGMSALMLALINVGSSFGRAIPGFVADYIGRFNTMICTVVLCAVSVFALWLPAGGSLALLIVFTLVFGFASGSNISLAAVCVGQVCSTEEYGRYYSTAYMLVSLGWVFSCSFPLFLLFIFSPILYPPFSDLSCFCQLPLMLI